MTTVPDPTGGDDAALDAALATHVKDCEPSLELQHLVFSRAVRIAANIARRFELDSYYEGDVASFTAEKGMEVMHDHSAASLTGYMYVVARNRALAIIAHPDEALAADLFPEAVAAAAGPDGEFIEAFNEGSTAESKREAVARLLFDGKQPPHKVLAYACRHLLLSKTSNVTLKPSRVASTYGEMPFDELTPKFASEAQPRYKLNLKVVCRPLFQQLPLLLDAVLVDADTRRTYATLLDRRCGETSLGTYKRGKKLSTDISQWIKDLTRNHLVPRLRGWTPDAAPDA